MLKKEECMWLIVREELSREFPELKAYLFKIFGVDISQTRMEEINEQLTKDVVDKIKNQYMLDTLKDVHLVRLYRNFFWRVGIDPTKTRPAAEALIRRILSDKSFPRVNPLVDAYNLASMESGVPIAAFDTDENIEPLLMRKATQGEIFLGIGMKDPDILKGKEVVVSDREKLIVIYPHRDAEAARIKEKTTNALFMICGAPGVDESYLQRATQLTEKYVSSLCGGTSVHEW